MGLENGTNERKKVRYLAVAVCANAIELPIILISSADSSFVVPMIPNTTSTDKAEIFIAYNEEEDRFFNTIHIGGSGKSAEFTNNTTLLR